MRKVQNQNTCSKRKSLITAFACHEMLSAKEFESAGITYQVGINLDENGQAIATLQYIHNKKLVEVDKIRKHLSWGERNAFSLVLFMFYAISENAKLIVLDDPISSFDTNKKYAIIHRMFSKQSGILPRSFYKKTVLMLTHDFEATVYKGLQAV